MTELSARFALPFLQSGQAQKELYHNEALALIDLALHPVVQAAGVGTPPATPAAGQCWIVGAGATGAWSGRDGEIAGWTGGGWRFVVPSEGMLAWVVANGLWVRRSGDAWLLGALTAASLSIAGDQVVGARQPAIAAPASGTTVDAEARAAIGMLLTALRAHGLIAS